MKTTFINDFSASIRVSVRGECDQVGEVCDFCGERTCASNVYIVDQYGYDGMTCTCDSIACINRAIELGHYGEDDPLVEVYPPSEPVFFDEDGHRITLAA